MARMKKRIALLDTQEKEIMLEIKGLTESDNEMKQLIILICTLPGVGLLTAATVLAETNGFDLIRSKRQLTSYAGLDVVEKQSGTSVKKKPRISKKGIGILEKLFIFLRYQPSGMMNGLRQFFQDWWQNMESK